MCLVAAECCCLMQCLLHPLVQLLHVWRLLLQQLLLVLLQQPDCRLLLLLPCQHQLQAGKLRLLLLLKSTMQLLPAGHFCGNSFANVLQQQQTTTDTRSGSMHARETSTHIQPASACRHPAPPAVSDTGRYKSSPWMLLALLPLYDLLLLLTPNASAVSCW